MSCIVAFGAVSALGEGASAFAVPEPGEAPRVAVARDPELEAAGLTRPFVARAAHAAPPDHEGEDRALLLLDRGAEGCARMLDRAAPGWRSRRVGLVLGTSSGGLRTCERLFSAVGAEPSAANDTSFTYFAGITRLAARLGVGPCRASLVLGACASSTVALGLASAWLAEGACDLVIAGGYDAVGVFVAAGFEAIRATSKEGVMRPFTGERDGLVLGEGAALVALVREASREPVGYLRGFGASTDAVHLTAPDRSGGGLARAALAALATSEGVKPGDVGIVSAHGTATEFNDAAEAKAIDAALGAAAGGAVLHAFKPQIGHTLGAAGLLESLACFDAMRRGILPPTAGATGSAPMPELGPRLLSVGERGAPRSALKLSAAFGGANASLVLSLDPPPVAPSDARAASDASVSAERGPREPRRVWLSRGVHVTREPTLDELVARTGSNREKLARTDRLTRLALAAVGELRAECGSLEGAGIVVGHGLATHETNALFWDGIRKRGPRLAEPRRFPFTSPNAPCGECAIAYRLTGPGFAVGLGEAGGLEALAAAATLLRAGHASRMVVVAVDDVGPASGPYVAGPSGAVAVLLTLEPGRTELVLAEAFVGQASPTGDAVLAPFAPCHAALVPLTTAAPPELLECGPSWGVFARVRLRAVE